MHGVPVHVARILVLVISNRHRWFLTLILIWVATRTLLMHGRATTTNNRKRRNPRANRTLQRKCIRSNIGILQCVRDSLGRLAFVIWKSNFCRSISLGRMKRDEGDDNNGSDVDMVGRMFISIFRFCLFASSSSSSSLLLLYTYSNMLQNTVPSRVNKPNRII